MHLLQCTHVRCTGTCRKLPTVETYRILRHTSMASFEFDESPRASPVPAVIDPRMGRDPSPLGSGFRNPNGLRAMASGALAAQLLHRQQQTTARHPSQSPALSVLLPRHVHLPQLSAPSSCSDLWRRLLRPHGSSRQELRQGRRHNRWRTQRMVCHPSARSPAGPHRPKRDPGLPRPKVRGAYPAYDCFDTTPRQRLTA